MKTRSSTASKVAKPAKAPPKPRPARSGKVTKRPKPKKKPGSRQHQYAQQGYILCSQSDVTEGGVHFHHPDLSKVNDAVLHALKNGRKLYEAIIPSNGIDESSKVRAGSWCWVRGRHVPGRAYHSPAFICAIREHDEGDRTIISLLLCFARPRDLKEPYWNRLYPRTSDHVLSESFDFFPLSCVEEGFEHMPVDGKMEFLDGYDVMVKVQSNQCFKAKDDPTLYDCEVYVEKPDPSVKVEATQVKQEPRPSTAGTTYHTTLVDRRLLYPDEESDGDDCNPQNVKWETE